MAYKGVAYAAFAKGTYTDGQAPVYSNGRIFTRLCSAEISYTYADAKVYADNTKALVERTVTGGTVNINVLSLDDDAEVDVLGYIKSEDGAIEVSDNDPPIGGFGCVEMDEADDGSDVFVGTVVYKSQFVLQSKNHTTKGESTEFSTPTLNGDMMGVKNDSTMKNKYEIHKRFSTEADALAFVKTTLNIT